MNKRIKIILIITSILVLLGINNVFAASGGFSINKTSATVEIGKTTTFSITATNCGGKFTIKSSNTSVATVSSGEEWIENTSKEITITAKTAGTATITIVADDVASTDEEVVSGTKTITVTVPEKKVENNTGTTTTPNTPSTNTNTNTGTSGSTPAEKTKSSEARLKNLGIKPKEYDFSGFKKDKTEYSVEVPNNVDSVEVYAEPVDTKAKVSGAGKVTLNEGNNKIGIKVTAEDGKTTKTYTLTIKRKTAEDEEKQNGENRLKSLAIKPKEYDFSGFNGEKTEYTAEVPNDIKQIEIVATAMDSNAQITGTGVIDLKEGKNELKVEVIAVNGDKKTYILTVTREEAEEKEVLGLTSLSIKGLTLTPNFKSKTYEYTVKLEEDLTSLEITAKANNEDATVEIVGNENLQDGENTITILVENKETEEVATYQIIVNKNVVVQEVIEQTSWLKPSTWGKEEKIKIAIIIVIIILIICAILLKIKISKDTPKAIKVDLPGAEELDKAILEHQELVQEENFMQGIIGEKNTDINYDEQNYIEEIAKTRFGSQEDSIDEKPKRRGRHF